MRVTLQIFGSFLNKYLLLQGQLQYTTVSSIYNLKLFSHRFSALLLLSNFLSLRRETIQFSPAIGIIHILCEAISFIPRMSTIPSLSLKYPKPFLSIPNSIFHGRSFLIRYPALKGFNGGGLNAVTCSIPSPLTGRVGLHRREGSLCLLSFGANSRSFNVAEDEEKVDYSQALSALLPFVVVLTAVAALSQPATFTW